MRKYLPGADLRLWARRQEAREALKTRGFAENQVFADLKEAAAGADLLVLATPVGAMGQLAQKIVDSGEIGENAGMAHGAVVTDVGSVKSAVVAELEPIFGRVGIDFIGSHPMAGSEKTGLEHADAALLQNARCIVTPTGQSQEQTRKILEFWQSLGASTFLLDPAEHDRVVARISHLPHAAASAIVMAALGADSSPMECSGGGFRDTTRVASGAPEMWAEILLENQAEVQAALEDLRGNLREMLEFLRNRDQKNLAAYLARAKELRDRLEEF